MDNVAGNNLAGNTVAGNTAMPTNVVVVLLDSLNRHLLGAYGGDEFDTPNLDRFARRHATRFTRHHAGSLPCMPARHDILCGSLDFLWRPWGSIEVWEQPITRALAEAGVTTALVTDHPHLFETGGENYHCDFGVWDYLRGHEGDPWRSRADPSWMGAPALPARAGGWWFEQTLGLSIGERPYDRSRTWFRDEGDFPGPRTMAEAARFLRQDAPAHDRWMLFVDEFDPHEPFDTPEPWASRYQDGPWDAEQIIWPPYADGAVSAGQLDERSAAHIRANYGAKLSMIDHHLGGVMDAFDEQGLWEDTALIVCTDHGHYLGDQRRGRDLWGKPGVPVFEPLGHTPLLIAWPGRTGGGTCDALTTNVDLFATLADVFDVGVAHRTHGRSLVPALDSDAAGFASAAGRASTAGRASAAGRDWVLAGYYGSWVSITDGVRSYARGAVDDATNPGNFPLSMWSNRWSTMPLHLPGIEGLPVPDDRAVLDRVPGSSVPVLRQPFRPGDMLPFWANASCVDDHHLYDLSVDPDEQENRVGESGEAEMVELLRTALAEIEAPREQFDRLGLS